MESETIKGLTQVKYEAEKLADKILDLPERTTATINISLTLKSVAEQLDAILGSNGLATTIDKELHERILKYKEQCKTDPLYQGPTLEEAKANVAKRSCAHCVYGGMGNNTRCISPNIPDYYIANDCPYFIGLDLLENN